MKVKIWGARGSIPAPLTSPAIRDKLIATLEGAKGVDLNDPLAIRSYVDSLPMHLNGTVGGNTSCVELRTDDHLVIIDAGSGLRSLGWELMSGPCGRGQGVIHLFLSHTHWDHIQGFPFFVPAFVPGNRIFIYSVHDVEPTLVEQQRPATFPVSLEYMQATIEFVHLQDNQPIMIGDMRVNNLCLPHPGRAYAYRFEHEGSVFVYASDAEYKHLDDQSMQPFLRFFAGADALIFDAQFTLRDSLIKIDWGHSASLIGADIARRAGIKRLVLFHHDPLSSDADLNRILDQTVAYQATQETNPSYEVLLAYEGLELDLAPTPQFHLHQLPNEETTILHLAGDFDRTIVSELQHRFVEVPHKANGSAEAERRRSLVVDLAGLTRLNVNGLRALIDLRRQWEGRAIVLASLSPRVRRMIELANCLDFFAIYPNVQSALAALEAHDTMGLPGQSLKNRYQLEARLGESEMGAVFKATDRRLDRAVTIKVISPSYSQTAASRLLRQAQRMARLNSPNIVSIYDADEEQGMAYVVMEHVAGKTLRHLLTQGSQERSAQPLFAPLDVAVDILQALEHAHSKGVIHGNLKPENVLISNMVKLTDFGLRWIEDGRSLTEAPLLIGTPAYLAPEQIQGRPVDARTDLYALGIILYELFTNECPFEGTEAEVLDQHLNRMPVPPRQLNPELSRSLEHLILKLLAKDPDQRYATATQVRRVLASLRRVPNSGQNETAPALMVHQRQQKIVGRDVQLSRLLALWALAETGRGQIVLLAGEAGVGKTRLSEEVASNIEEATLLVGRSSELEGHIPYQPFIEIVRDYLTRTPLAELEQQLDEAAPVVAALLPELHDLFPKLPPLVALEPEQERMRLMHGMTQFIARAAEARPWLVVLDDLHWADPASLQMLHYLARHLTSLSILIIGTYRDVELDNEHPLRELLRGLSRYPVYHQLTLNRLEADGVRQVLEGIWRQAVPEEWVEAIYQCTGGNPFYVEEVAQNLIDEGAVTLRDGTWHFAPAIEVRLPQSVRDIVLRRVSRLSPATQQALRFAAVLGQQFTFSDLLAVVGGPEDQLLESIDEALERDLLRGVEAGSSLAFSHAEIQQVVYEELSAPRRRTLHRQVGRTLERQHATNHEAIAGQLAHHFMEAGDHERGFQYSLQAAQQAQSLHAYQTALAWYTVALEHLSDSSGQAGRRLELYEGLGQVLRHQGRLTEAISAYKAMTAAAEAKGDPIAQARAWTGVGDTQSQQGDYRASLASVEIAEALARAADAPTELAAALYQKGWALMRLGNIEEALNLGEQSLSLSAQLNSRSIMARNLNLIGGALLKLGRVEQSESYYEEALLLYREIGDQRGATIILNNLGECARRRGDHAAALRFYQEALPTAQRMGARTLEASLQANLGIAQLGLGQPAEAEISLRRAMHINAQGDRTVSSAEAMRFLALALMDQAKLSDAVAVAREAMALSLDTGGREDIGAAWYILGRVGSHLDEPIEINGVLHTPTQSFAESLRIFAEAGMLGDRARVLRAWGRYELKRGDWEQGQAMWQEAQGIFTQLGMPLEVERMQTERAPQ